MKTRVIVSAIIEKEGMILLGKKPKNVGPYPNTWHLLGGGINMDGERIIDGVRREVREEAGIEIKNIIPYSFDDDIEPNREGVLTHLVFMVFKAEYDSGELKPNDDIEVLKWFPKAEVAKLELTRPSIKLFKAMGLVL